MPLPFIVQSLYNGTGTKNVLKGTFEFSIQSSVYSSINVAKVSLLSTLTRLL